MESSLSRNISGSVKKGASFNRFSSLNIHHSDVIRREAISSEKRGLICLQGFNYHGERYGA